MTNALSEQRCGRAGWFTFGRTLSCHYPWTIDLPSFYTPSTPMPALARNVTISPPCTATLASLPRSCKEKVDARDSLNIHVIQVKRNQQRESLNFNDIGGIEIVHVRVTYSRVIRKRDRQVLTTNTEFSANFISLLMIVRVAPAGR